ncbi:hypothetical protein [Mycobacterium servetii]|uniref:Transmembrane protein n=1 Tax=Mycobacterium servetii TaxID=3237418 RepID=A0ABV4BW14_9MYCO
MYWLIVSGLAVVTAVGAPAGHGFLDVVVVLAIAAAIRWLYKRATAPKPTAPVYVSPSDLHTQALQAEEERMSELQRAEAAAKAAAEQRRREAIEAARRAAAGDDGMTWG